MIRRRNVLFASAAALGLAAMPVGMRARAAGPMQNEYERRGSEYRAKALAAFPFERIETTGGEALETWRHLKKAKRGIPVVIGDDASLDNILTPFGPNGPLVPPPPSVESILHAAAGIRFPADLIAKQRADEQAGKAFLKASLAKAPNALLPTIIESDQHGHTHTLSREETLKEMMRGRSEPELGMWPEHASPSPGLAVAYDILNGKALPKVYIVLIPASDWTEIPAYLRWGGWNDCPPPEYHVAAFREWRDRYSAELVGMSFDTINLRVSRRPQTREEALALAREQYIYCSDIVDQGVGTLSQLAMDLMSNDWWYFWWD